jgi:hypothetical protein
VELDPVRFFRFGSVLLELGSSGAAGARAQEPRLDDVAELRTWALTL